MHVSAEAFSWIKRKISAEGKSGGFLRRMSALESTKQRTLDKKRAEKEYGEQVNKKVCMKCGSEQSYDEVIKRKKKCQSCGVPYQYKNTWKNVKGRFFDKLHISQQEAMERKAHQYEYRL